MLFHEIYSTYFQTVAKILAEAVEHPLTTGEINAIIQDYAFEESTLNIPESLGMAHYVYMLLYTDKSVCYISANYILMFLDYITNPKIKNPMIEIPAPISTYGSCDPACSRLSIPAPFDARTVVSQ